MAGALSQATSKQALRFFRKGAVIAAAVLDSGVLIPLPSPFATTTSVTSLCLPRVNVVVGRVITSFDLAFTSYLFFRTFRHRYCAINQRLSEEEIFNERPAIGWRRIARVLLRRRFAKLASLGVFTASSAAGLLTRISVIATIVPPTIALLLVLYAFNTALEVERKGVDEEHKAQRPDDREATVTADFVTQTSNPRNILGIPSNSSQRSWTVEELYTPVPFPLRVPSIARTSTSSRTSESTTSTRYVPHKWEWIPHRAHANALSSFQPSTLTSAGDGDFRGGVTVPLELRGPTARERAQICRVSSKEDIYEWRAASDDLSSRVTSDASMWALPRQWVGSSRSGADELDASRSAQSDSKRNI
ncbi:hypothetical protein P7C70_g7575, partial [Phenoliferia sp. Uapishka_3]